MATSTHPETDESDVFSLFPTSVWKVQLAPKFVAGINRTVRETLQEMNPRLPELAPGDSWQSDHQLHTLDEFRELVSSIMRSTGTILKLLKIGYEEIELTGCWANITARGASHAMHSHPNNFLSSVYYVQTWPGAATSESNEQRTSASFNLMFSSFAEKLSKPTRDAIGGR